MSKAQATKRRDMPTAARLRAFWAPKLIALGKGCDPEVFLEPVVSSTGIATWQCFCCGKPTRLERAHIKPLSLGGDNSAQNIHMLCRICHLESELYQDEAYWRWFLGKPFRHFMDPEHYAHVWHALGARDARHAAEMLVQKHGTDPDKIAGAVRSAVRSVYSAQ